METTKITIYLSGEARENFDKICHFFENNSLTITSRSTWITPEDRERDIKFQLDNLKTRLQICGAHNIDLKQTVQNAVNNVNSMYHNTAEIISEP